MHSVFIWDAIHIEASAGLITMDTGYDTWGLVLSADVFAELEDLLHSFLDDFQVILVGALGEVVKVVVLVLVKSSTFPTDAWCIHLGCCTH